MNINTPSPAEVNKYLAKWDASESYVSQEQALNKLFLKLCPRNTEMSDVLIKCSVLNDFYGTNIFRVYPVAKHILELNIDKRLDNGDLALVNDIAQVQTGNKIRNYYSFASKYCSHHCSEKYAIYDSYVEKCLMYFKKKDKFSSFLQSDLKEYEKFVRVLLEFKKFYGLDKYSLKEIDQYLWQLGKEFFPNRY